MEAVDKVENLPGAQPIRRKPVVEVTEGDLQAPVSEVKEKVLGLIQAPAEYVEIALSSCGKLGLPAKIHVRDYLASDVLKLASITSENIVEVLIGILDNMIYEDVDIYKMTEKDMEEILVNIHLRFWGSVIESYPFEATIEDYESMTVHQKAKLDAGQDPFTTDINLAALSTKPIKEGFKDPFTIKWEEQGVNVKFTLPRIGNAVMIRKFCESKFSQYEEKFSVVKMLLKQQEEGERVQIDPKLYQEYADFCKERDAYYLMLSQALLIEEINGKPCETIEEKIEAYKQVSLQTWVMFNKVQDDIMSFGIEPEVEVVSPQDETKTIKRRFRFQLVDLIPAYRLPTTNGFVVEY